MSLAIIMLYTNLKLGEFICLKFFSEGFWLQKEPKERKSWISVKSVVCVSKRAPRVLGGPNGSLKGSRDEGFQLSERL